NTLDVARSLTDRPEPDVDDNVPYTLKQRDCTGNFAPANTTGINQKYVLTVWAKLGDEPVTNTFPAEVLYSYPEARGALEIDCNPVTYLSEERSNIIDGWQRIEYLFEIPATAQHNIKVSLVNDNQTTPAWFDDIRIHPFNSDMVATVYDPVTLRLWAQLDDRNFATFYEYDEEGALVRTKRETERGIFTLQESRSGLKK
ncbi:MAG: hypothetical protein AAGB22_10145, partial [Bacteroidota bacterium]